MNTTAASSGDCGASDPLYMCATPTTDRHIYNVYRVDKKKKKRKGGGKNVTLLGQANMTQSSKVGPVGEAGGGSLSHLVTPGHTLSWYMVTPGHTLS